MPFGRIDPTEAPHHGPTSHLQTHIQITTPNHRTATQPRYILQDDFDFLLRKKFGPDGKKL